MAKITLEKIQHSYYPGADDRDDSAVDWALKQLDIDWDDGGAYALLGPSGCGKTTLLNIISGLITPTRGRVFFDGNDVTQTATNDRHIAQVFQFPVVYDTMSVYDNLAFPLRNRRMPEPQIAERIAEIAKMLELEPMLQQRAAGLSADGKQKISLGRGLVRDDVNAIMFDEPLTVIDPHLKWLLRSKLKELHQRVGATMIYVTHDQTEALTFADKVVVMYEGSVVQIGSPVELFERPRHTFVGHFIGSPGMNVLPCRVGSQQEALFGNIPVPVESTVGIETAIKSGVPVSLEIGIRPEFVHFAEAESGHSIPVRVAKVDDLGRYQLVTVDHEGQAIKMIVGEGEPIPTQSPAIQFNHEHTRLYIDGWVVS